MIKSDGGSMMAVVKANMDLGVEENDYSFSRLVAQALFCQCFSLTLFMFFSKDYHVGLGKVL